MSRLRTSPFVLVVAVLVFGCPAWIGCGDGPSGPGGVATGGSSRIITLHGAEGLKGFTSGMARDRCSGLQTLGDINSDGCPDIVVALSRRESSPPAEHTWIEAYSGRNGQRLWSLQGRHDSDDPSRSYRLGPLAVLEDCDGDGMRDVYCRGAHNKRSAFLISGASGNVIGRYPIARDPVFDVPMRCQDHNGDGVPDLYFSRNVEPLTVVILSGKDLSELARLEGVWPEAASSRIQWVLSRYHDENGDGVRDCLVRCAMPRQQGDGHGVYQYGVLDGVRFTQLRTFQCRRPRVGAKTFFATIDDVNDDQRGDFVLSSGAGGGPEGRVSRLQVVSGADGAVVWEVVGDQFEAGAKMYSVDAKTGKKSPLRRDVEFGSPVVTVPDLDGDQVPEIAALADSGSADGGWPAVLLVSGRTGKPVSACALEERQGALWRTAQMVFLPAASPAVVVSARDPSRDTVLAVFELAAR